MADSNNTKEMETKNPSNKNPIIVGLDIGTTKVVAIAGRKNEFGKLEILGFGKAESAGVSHGVVMNIEQCIRSIEESIKRCLESNPSLEINDVYVGIAGQHIKSLQTRGDRVRLSATEEINKADIDLLIHDQYKTYLPAGDQIIDVIPQDFVVDNTPAVLDPIGMSGVKIGANFHIISGDKNAIRNIGRCVDKSGLKIRDLVLQPLASAAAVMNDEDLEAGVAIVDIGGGTTDLAVFYDGMLKHTAVIPYAGVNISNDIRNGLGVLKAQAEQLKTQFGTALANEANANAFITIPGLRGMSAKEISVKNLAHIIQARMTEILDHVVYHLKLVGLDKKLLGGIILTGGGAQLKNLIQLTEYVTGMGARLGYPNEHLAGSNAEGLQNPMFATCVGLILRGYHDYETGRLRHIGEGGNIIHLGGIEAIEVSYLTAGVPKPDHQAGTGTESGNPAPESMDEAAIRGERRSQKFGKLFDGLKNKFIGLFEDIEDQKMD